MQRPRNDRQFIDQTDNQKDDDDMIVQSTTKYSIREQKVESDESVGQRDNIGDERRPKSNLTRNADNVCFYRILGHDYELVEKGNRAFLRKENDYSQHSNYQWRDRFSMVFRVIGRPSETTK